MPNKTSDKQILDRELSATDTSEPFPRETEPVYTWEKEVLDEIEQEKRDREEYLHYLQYAPHPSSKKMRRGYSYATDPGSMPNRRRPGSI